MAAVRAEDVGDGISPDAAGGGASSACPESTPSSAPTSVLKRGDRVGDKYRLDSLIAKGGMAAVWLAHNEALDLPVAIKFIRTDLAGPKDDRLADRLLQEAQATAGLGHHAIVRVHDFGKTDRGVPYLVMELLEGESLDVAIERRGRIAAPKAVRALLPVAHALATAHDKGIVHRDLKPENIHLSQTADGRVQPKLIDFGISRVAKPGAKRLTFVGESVGTPAYMSPEQVFGEEIDHRADVWSFCVLLYEMITGRLPFQGGNITAMARAITREAPPPIGEFSAGDDRLRAILDKGLAKDRRERWSSMRELGSELACWLLDRGITEDVGGASLEVTWLAPSSGRAPADPLASIPPGPRSSPATGPSSSTPSPPAGAAAPPPTPDEVGTGRPPPTPADRTPTAPSSSSDELRQPDPPLTPEDADADPSTSDTLPAGRSFAHDDRIDSAVAATDRSGGGYGDRPPAPLAATARSASPLVALALGVAALALLAVGIVVGLLLGR